MRVTIFNKQNVKAYGVPVNEGSTYTWTLMGEEYITVIFQSDRLLQLQKGYYADIPQLGRFEIIDLQRPTKSYTGDGWDYELRMDRPWYKWKNRIHFFRRGTVGGMEAKWSLTDTIQNHAGVLLYNLTALGFNYCGQPYAVAIDNTIDATTSKLVPFDKTSILDALTAIADAFECEWWIEQNIIHFGKCETGETISLTSGEELGNLVRQEDSSEKHGTRLYAFGSTRNLNSNYRRQLNNPFTVKWCQKVYSNKIRFTLASPSENANLTLYSESHKVKFTGGELANQTFDFKVVSGTYEQNPYSSGSFASIGTWNNPVFEIDLGGYTTAAIAAATSVSFIIGDPTGGQPEGTGMNTWVKTWQQENFFAFAFSDIKIPQKAITNSTTLRRDGEQETERLLYVGVMVDSDGATLHDGDEAYRLQDGTSLTAEGKVHLQHLATAYINRTYTKPADGEQDVAIQGIADVALKLPAGTPYIDSEEGLSEDEVTEVIRVYDKIYPRCLLTITEITEVDAQTTDEDTGNVEYWKAYRFKAKLQDNTPFEFDKEYIVQDEDKPLSIHFESGLLNGMDFEVQFNPQNSSSDTRTFEIVRNDTYTLQLPNATAKPQVGDTLYMYNMDVTFIDDTLITAAENELLAQAQADIAELRKDDGTYTGDTNPVLCETEDIDLGYGQRVTLVAPEFFTQEGHTRDSRIIAFTKNLDDLYTASYTIGDSTAYNRLDNMQEDIKEIVYYNGQIKNSESQTISIDAYNRKIAELQSNMRLLEAKMDTKLSKLQEDTAKEMITLSKGMTVGDYVSGKFGTGARIDLYGNTELQSLTIREFLETPEYRYNRIDITVGNKWRAPGGGVIQEVIPDTDGQGNELTTGIIKLHLEDGEIGTVAVDDICQGIFHDGMNLENNAQADYDDSIGNFLFAGFYTCYFRITQIIDTERNGAFRYALRPISDTWTSQKHPKAAMHFVSYGSFTDTTRQTSRYSTRTYERYLYGVNNWEFDSSMIGAQFGDLTNLSVFGLDMTGYSAYLENIYMTGTIEELENIPPKMVIEDSGDGFLAWGETCTITCTVMKGWRDISDRVTQWTITRDTADPSDDAVWNQSTKAQEFDGTIELEHTEQHSDLGADTNVISTIFYINAIGNDGTLIAQGQITL